MKNKSTVSPVNTVLEWISAPSLSHCPPLHFPITHTVLVITSSIQLFPVNPCSPPNLCRPYFPVSLQFSHSGFIAFFSLTASSLSLSLFAAIPPSLFHSLTQRAVFRRNPILSLFSNLLFHFTPILSHCSAHTIPTPPSFQPFSLSPQTHTHTHIHRRVHTHMHKCSQTFAQLHKHKGKKGRCRKQKMLN